MKKQNLRKKVKQWRDLCGKAASEITRLENAVTQADKVEEQLWERMETLAKENVALREAESEVEQVWVPECFGVQVEALCKEVLAGEKIEVLHEWMPLLRRSVKKLAAAEKSLGMADVVRMKGSVKREKKWKLR